MYFRQFKIWVPALAALALLMVATVFVQGRLDTIVKEDKLVDEASIEGLPPMVAFFSTMSTSNPASAMSSAA